MIELANVSITNFPSTQAITAVSLPLPSGASTSALQTTGNTSLGNIDTKTPSLISGRVPVDGSGVVQPVSGTFWQATQPVSGTFWQATQPVSGPLTDTQLRASAVPVSGSFWQTTQPISGTVAVSNFPASQAVTGSVSVSNFPATQPVSGTVTANAGSGTMATSLASLPALIAGSAIIGKVGIDQTTPGTTNLVSAAQSGTWTVQPGNTANTTAWKVDGSAVIQPVSGTVTANVGTVPTLTKATQGSTGYSVQDLKDAGRNQTNYFMAAQVVSTATDALMSLTGYKAGAAVVATTTPAVVTAGKTYRITSITLTYVTIVTTPGAVRFTLRANTGGVVAITSPAVNAWTVGEPTGIAPVAGKFYTYAIPFPEGIEFPAGTGIGLSMVGLGATGTAAIVGYGIASITGFEY